MKMIYTTPNMIVLDFENESPIMGSDTPCLTNEFADDSDQLTKSRLIPTFKDEEDASEEW